MPQERKKKQFSVRVYKHYGASPSLMSVGIIAGLSTKESHSLKLSLSPPAKPPIGKIHSLRSGKHVYAVL